MAKGLPTGKSLGLAKGDWCSNGGWACRILSDAHTFAPCCMVWGYEAEAGSVYATDLKKITKEQAIEMAKALGHTIDPRYLVAKLK